MSVKSRTREASALMNRKTRSIVAHRECNYCASTHKAESLFRRSYISSIMAPQSLLLVNMCRTKFASKQKILMRRERRTLKRNTYKRGRWIEGSRDEFVQTQLGPHGACLHPSSLDETFLRRQTLHLTPWSMKSKNVKFNFSHSQPENEIAAERLIAQQQTLNLFGKRRAIN